MTARAGLTVTGLAKSFADGPVFRDLDLAVRAGELVLVTGGRESGKTSLLRCLSGTYRPSAGVVTLDVDGARGDLAAVGARTLAWVRRHHLATFDGPLVAPPRQPTATAVARAARVSGADAARALDRLGVGRLAEVALGRLRPAQRRAAALAAALAAPAPVLLLDDPEPVADPDVLTGWLAERRAAGAAVVVTAGGPHAFTPHTTATIHLDEGRT